MNVRLIDRLARLEGMTRSPRRPNGSACRSRQRR